MVHDQEFREYQNRNVMMITPELSLPESDHLVTGFILPCTISDPRPVSSIRAAPRLGVLDRAYRRGLQDPVAASGMVRRGAFGLRLVDAATRQPLEEHEKDGEVWVVGKPGAEFFLESRTWHGTNVMGWPIDIDGVGAGYSQYFSPHQPWKVHGAAQSGGGANRAFRFATIPAAADGQAAVGEFGLVEMTWTEAAATDTPAGPSVTPAWTSLADATSAGTKKEGVGALKSTLGTTTQSCVRGAFLWSRVGPPLQTITIRYCEEAGLVARKIIALPASTNNKRAGDPVGNGKGKKKAAGVVVIDDVADTAGPAPRIEETPVCYNLYPARVVKVHPNNRIHVM